jgi:hypothetical protein
MVPVGHYVWRMLRSRSSSMSAVITALNSKCKIDICICSMKNTRT